MEMMEARSECVQLEPRSDYAMSRTTDPITGFNKLHVSLGSPEHRPMFTYHNIPDGYTPRPPPVHVGFNVDDGPPTPMASHQPTFNAFSAPYQSPVDKNGKLPHDAVGMPFKQPQLPSPLHPRQSPQQQQLQQPLTPQTPQPQQQQQLQQQLQQPWLSDSQSQLQSQLQPQQSSQAELRTLQHTPEPVSQTSSQATSQAASRSASQPPSEPTSQTQSPERPSSHPSESGDQPVQFAAKKKKKKILQLETFNDGYELLDEVLGKGEMAVVQACRDKRSCLPYAVKIIQKDNPCIMREQIIREMDILEECKGQPNIIQLIKFYEADREFYFVLERLDGGPLLEHIQASKVFTEKQAAAVTRDIAGALSFLHSHGITHRDLKPQNILCVYKDQPSPAKLCDFGLGTKAQDSTKAPPLHTAVGTPEFMAPEVAEAIALGERRTFDRLCDLWSLGVVVYIMLCGQPPFSGDCGTDCGWKRGEHCEYCAENLLEQIQDCAIDFKNKAWRKVTPAAKDLIARMLVKEDRRITADMVLKHPWLSQEAPATPLYTPDLLRQLSHTDELQSFAAQANEQQRKSGVDGDDVGPLHHPTSSALMMRRSSRNLATSFNSILDKPLEDIHTPKFNTVMATPPKPKTLEVPKRVQVGFDA